MPTKGVVEPGRDADLVLFDPGQRRTIRQAELHHTSDFTPYEGLEVDGVVRQVLSRGRVIVRDGTWLGARGHGRYVARAIA
jgi:dihydropyrimidinase